MYKVRHVNHRSSKIHEYHIGSPYLNSQHHYQSRLVISTPSIYYCSPIILQRKDTREVLAAAHFEGRNVQDIIKTVEHATTITGQENILCTIYSNISSLMGDSGSESLCMTKNKNLHQIAMQILNSYQLNDVRTQDIHSTTLTITEDGKLVPEDGWLIKLAEIANKLLHGNNNFERVD